MTELNDRSTRASADDADEDLPEDNEEDAAVASPAEPPSYLSEQVPTLATPGSFPSFQFDQTGNSISFDADAGNSGTLGAGADAPTGAVAGATAATDRPSVVGMTQWYQQNFDKIDKNNDGTITREEVETGLLDPKIATGDGAVYLAASNSLTAAVAQEFSGKKDENETEKCDQPVGFTRANLKALEEAAKKQDDPITRDNFEIAKLKDEINKIDNNKDRCITRAELDAALAQDHWSPQQREAMEKLKERFTEVGKLTDDSSPLILGEGAAIPPSPPLIPKEAETDPGVEYVTGFDLEKLPSTQSSLVDDLQRSIEATVDHVNGREAIDQQGNGSCFLLANLEAMVAQNPDAMKDMIKDNGDGTVTVTFPGDKDHPATIKKPTEGEEAEFSRGDAGIIEKAFGQYLANMPKDDRERYLGFLDNEPVKPTLVQHEIGAGGYARPALELLTGQVADVKDVKRMTEDEIKTALTEAAEAGRIITAGSRVSTEPDSGIQRRHVYAISVDPTTGQIPATNPNKPSPGVLGEPTNLDGTPRDGRADGTFPISVAELKRSFAEVYSAPPK